VFFVLSGFLITTLLVGEWQANGRIHITRFYLRRARRLLPALFLMLVTVVLVTMVVARAELGRLRGDVIAAVLYVTNWTQIAWNRSYFQALGPPSLLEHLWSLAVEEQFYLIWPLVLVACLASRRRYLPLLVTVAGIAASTLLMAALFDPYHDPSRVYYGSDTHAAPVLIGAAVALLRVTIMQRQRATRRGRRHVRAAAPVWADAAALVGAATVLVFMLRVHFTASGLYRGGFLVVGVATSAVVLAAIRPATLTARLFGTRTLRWIGVRSYGIYLWHWPIIALTLPERHPPVHGLVLDALRIALAVSAAALSYRFVELPIRTRGLWPALAGGARRHVAVLRSATAVLAVLAVVAVVARGLAGAHLATAAAGPAGDVAAARRRRRPAASRPRPLRRRRRRRAGPRLRRRRRRSRGRCGSVSSATRRA
jgi:peptidoglycan/LPS O-acetylase OafA/YrhL